MWKVSSNSEKFTLVGKHFHSSNVLSLSFHENKPLMATGGEDGVFCLSNTDHGEIYFKSDDLGGVVESVCFGTALANQIGCVVSRNGRGRLDHVRSDQVPETVVVRGQFGS